MKTANRKRNKANSKTSKNKLWGNIEVSITPVTICYRSMIWISFIELDWERLNIYFFISLLHCIAIFRISWYPPLCFNKYNVVSRYTSFKQSHIFFRSTLEMCFTWHKHIPPSFLIMMSLKKYMYQLWAYSQKTKHLSVIVSVDYSLHFPDFCFLLLSGKVVQYAGEDPFIQKRGCLTQEKKGGGRNICPLSNSLILNQTSLDPPLLIVYVYQIRKWDNITVCFN